MVQRIRETVSAVLLGTTDLDPVLLESEGPTTFKSGSVAPRKFWMHLLLGLVRREREAFTVLEARGFCLQVQLL